MRHTKINASISGFSLIEILVGILIVSIVMVAGFQALSAVGIGRVKLFEEMNIEKEAFYFSEKLFAEIKA
ncbi:MAG: type II secretion system protein [Candidatus Peribacteria bacterium]|nr:MAG: type II secretion system protein [Candidatus Peribacteria bacterium]